MVSAPPVAGPRGSRARLLSIPISVDLVSRRWVPVAVWRNVLDCPPLLLLPRSPKSETEWTRHHDMDGSR